MSEPDLPICSTHDEELAGWRCDAPACRKHLCGKCTAKSVNSFYCGLCGGTASRLVVARSDRGYATWLGKAAVYPLSVGLIPLAAVAVLCAVVEFTVSHAEPTAGEWGTISAVIRGSLVYVFALVAANSAARGNVPERGLAIRLARGIVATAIVWAPATLYLWWLGLPAKGLAHERLLYLYAVLAGIYLPVAVSTSVTDASFGDVANPFKLFELAWQLGRRYWLNVVVVALLAAATVGVSSSTVAQVRHAVTTPVASDVLAWLPTFAMLAVTAYAIGLIPFVWGDRFGWGDVSLYADPLHPKMVAEAKRKNVPVEVDASQQATAASGLAERNEARKLTDAIKEDQMVRALKIYEARTWSATAIDERQLLVLGKAAMRAKKNELAKKILDEIIARKGRIVSHALIALAQLHGQMGETTQADEIYRRVVAEFPNSEASKAAALKLKGG